ncbi:hypothetical protein LCGC14_1783430 [marine sediment metagenome]|uniref:Uncharacterized protein n=1 Tax=marine sediment metagenome TaxID=412755 RepID=A0A0F9HHA0_9ZZZZ
MGFLVDAVAKLGCPDDVPTDDVQIEQPEPGSYQEYLALTSAEDRADRLRMMSTQHGNADRVRGDAFRLGQWPLEDIRLPRSRPEPNMRRHWLVGDRREAVPQDALVRAIMSIGETIGAAFSSDFEAMCRQLGAAADNVVATLGTHESGPPSPRHGYRERHATGRREWWNRRAIDRDKQGRG